MKSRKVTRLFAILSAVALGLTACGNDGAQPGGENSQPSSTGQKEETRARGRRVQGGISGQDRTGFVGANACIYFSQADDVGYEEFYRKSGV